MADEISVDQLFAQQQHIRPLATIEQVDGKPELVKVTPWVKNMGCLCTLALVVPKIVITSVKTTGENHYCCGKQLEVVEVNFKKDASIAVADVFAQASSTANQHKSPSPSAPQPTSGPTMPAQTTQLPAYQYPQPMPTPCGPWQTMPFPSPYQFPPVYPAPYPTHGWPHPPHPPHPPHIPICGYATHCDRGCLQRIAPGCLAWCLDDPTGASCVACLGISYGTCCTARWECH